MLAPHSNPRAYPKPGRMEYHLSKLVVGFYIWVIVILVVVKRVVVNRGVVVNMGVIQEVMYKGRLCKKGIV